MRPFIFVLLLVFSACSEESKNPSAEFHNPLANPAAGPPAGNPDGKAFVPAETAPEEIDQFHRVVGNGTPVRSYFSAWVTPTCHLLGLGTRLPRLRDFHPLEHSIS
jgi:hypothetical protein